MLSVHARSKTAFGESAEKSPRPAASPKLLPVHRSPARARSPRSSLASGVGASAQVAHAPFRRRSEGMAVGIGTGLWSSRRRRFRRAPIRRPTQFHLWELFALVLVAAIACVLVTTIGTPMGGLFFLNVLALRTAVTDFSWRGETAMVVAMVSGVLCVLLIVCSLISPNPAQ